MIFYKEKRQFHKKYRISLQSIQTRYESVLQNKKVHTFISKNISAFRIKQPHFPFSEKPTFPIHTYVHVLQEEDEEHQERKSMRCGTGLFMAGFLTTISAQLSRQ